MKKNLFLFLAVFNLLTLPAQAVLPSAPTSYLDVETAQVLSEGANAIGGSYSSGLATFASLRVLNYSPTARDSAEAAKRFRLTPSAFAFRASAACTLFGTRTKNLPE